MKLSKKFIEDLHKIGEDAFIEKNQWIGKLVPDIIIDNLKKRGITPDDLEGVVCLTVEEAKAVNEAIEWLCSTLEDYEREHDNTPALIEGWNQMDFLEHRIEQAEKP